MKAVFWLEMKWNVKAILLALILLLQLVGKRFCQRVVYPRRQDASSFCNTPNGESGRCIVISNCGSLWRSRDYLLLRRSLCGFDEVVPKVCCPFTISTPDAVISTTPSANQERKPLRMHSPRPVKSSLKVPMRTTVKVTVPWVQVTTPMMTSLAAPQSKSDRKSSVTSIFPNDCGKNSVTFRRIVGGQESTPGTWPWMVVIYLTKRGIRSVECGGVLITSKHVLTAAHCFVNRRGKMIRSNMVSVRVGEHDLDHDDDHAMDVNVKKVMNHESFDFRTYQNDIAILELVSPVHCNKTVSPICLPHLPALRNESFFDNNAFVAGWGSTRFQGPGSSVLQEVQIRIWNTADCKEVYRKDVPITDLNLCAGDGGKDSCSGDSGGPLMLPLADGKFYVIGIVSFGKKCAEPNYPGVYVRVNKFLGWIEEKITDAS